MLALDAKDRFLGKVNCSDDCWEWMDSLYWSGYGRFWYNGKTRLAHRVSYSLFVGKVPEGVYVLHKCDNRKCVNPEHLFLGTLSDNMQDMVSKGRSYNGVRDGENNPNCKLTNKQIEQIRQSDRKHKELADEYNVHAATISRIKRRAGGRYK